MSEIEVRTESYDSPAAAILVAAAQADQVDRYGAIDCTPVDPAEFSPPRGVFLVVYGDGVPIGCGGYRTFPDDTTAEIKRVYVRPEARRRGIARTVLEALARAAAESGHRRMILDCGPLNAEALILWEECGYHRIPGYSMYKDDPGNRPFAKRLEAVDNR